MRRFLRRVYEETFVKTRPLPNPRWYEEQQKELQKTRKPLLTRIKIGWKIYRDTWTSAAERRRKQQEELIKAMQEQRQAVKDIHKESSGLMKDASPALKDYIQDWVAVYRIALQKFAQGFKDGKASSEWDAVTDWAQWEESLTGTQHKQPSTSNNKSGGVESRAAADAQATTQVESTSEHVARSQQQQHHHQQQQQEEGKPKAAKERQDR
ncbi:hypothetical protein PTSG_10540 [Salpingoeca rosetta]|uniref:Uncharacterized protein n=1 Tax=Salpingoeca rosetta (strain ATCC 50818 / BSB-021) TaxID=946362 RepID=F2URN0_SALR5|nr:uncharacterized protein PTSG_10540 [Salpingoeca rosetta]EGD80285.1 hypothetical protein PTSG_10540 [Salpingoeca rosetta]|eukprot:XP_004988075.1 hypothetical protein PTSG_10540 [Salpingoeca rosetta]